jgi:hypothetical protein
VFGDPYLLPAFGWRQDSGWPRYVSRYDCGCDFDSASAIDIVSGVDAQAGQQVIYEIVIIAMLLPYVVRRTTRFAMVTPLMYINK